MMSEPNPGGWNDWSPQEREDFFRAIARHRANAWRVTLLCGLTTLSLALVVAVLMAPLIYALLGLMLDLVNLVVPTPDLLTSLGRAIDASMSDAAPAPGAGGLMTLIGVAALPGLVIMGLGVWSIRRALLRSPLLDTGADVGRPPDPSRLEEQRLANTIEEMALAAAIPSPRIRVIEGGANAAVCGAGEGRATLLMGEALAGTLTRDELQGVAAHLVASIADGDLRIGLRAATTLGLFGLVARIGSSLTDGQALATTRRLARALVAPTAASQSFLLTMLTDPFGAAASDPESAGRGLTWRDWATMPLMGPIVLSGFLGGLVSSFLLTPLVAWGWRQRKLMADATAVRLTRQPDGLAGALERLDSVERGLPAGLWLAHLCVAAPGARAQAGLLGEGFVPVIPSTKARLAGLVRMGATPPSSQAASAPMPVGVVLVLGALGALVVPLLATVFVLIAWVSVALSALFLLLPIAWAHLFLR